MKKKMTVGEVITLIRREGKRRNWVTGSFDTGVGSCAIGLVMHGLGYEPSQMTRDEFDDFGFRINNAVYEACGEGKNDIIGLNDNSKSFEEALKKIKIEYGSKANTEIEFDLPARVF